MKKIVFVAHEMGLFPGHGGVASYLNVLVSQILERTEDYEVFVLAVVYEKKSKLLKNNNRLHISEIPCSSLHEQGKFVLDCLKKIRPDYVELTDYLALGLEALTYRAETDNNELSNTVFITLHHTASRECYEWNDHVSVKFAPAFIRECFARERSQMKLSDLTVAPSDFMNQYVTKNYHLKNVKTVLHPLVIEPREKKAVLKEVMAEYDCSPFSDSFVVSCISRIEGRKNQGLLVQQFVHFLENTKADAYLFLIGNSSINSVTGVDFKNEVYEYIPDEYRSRILFFDFMNSVEKERIYAISSLCVLASAYECLSLALVEAVAYEVPVMCSKYCGFSDYMGICRDNMLFDPFKENDLYEKITTFFYASQEERQAIIDVEKKELKKLAAFTETVDKRLSLYASVVAQQASEQIAHKTLILNERNFMQLIDGNLINQQYDSVLVSFSGDQAQEQLLLKIFCGVCNGFAPGDIIAYCPGSARQSYVELILENIPFFVNEISIDVSLCGHPLIDVLSQYASNTEIFSLIASETPQPLMVQKKAQFIKSMLVNGFYSENLLCLEDRI